MICIETIIHFIAIGNTHSSSWTRVIPTTTTSTIINTTDSINATVDIRYITNFPLFIAIYISIRIHIHIHRYISSGSTIIISSTSSSRCGTHQIIGSATRYRHRHSNTDGTTIAIFRRYGI